MDCPPQAQSSKVLVIFAHPEPQQSVANSVLLNAIKPLPNVTVHDLYAHYPDFFIDVEREQALLAAHDVIVFQHPLYMYSCPALLKEWFDRVLSKDYAHGDGRALVGKRWRSVITTGGAAEAYCNSGYNRFTIGELLRPFELMAALCQMQWVSPLVVHWARRIPHQALMLAALRYQEWIIDPSVHPDPLDIRSQGDSAAQEGGSMQGEGDGR